MSSQRPPAPFYLLCPPSAGPAQRALEALSLSSMDPLACVMLVHPHPRTGSQRPVILLLWWWQMSSSLLSLGSSGYMPIFHLGLGVGHK